jgi:hypothetical protein
MLTLRILIFAAFFATTAYKVKAQANFNHLAEITGSARINSTKVDKKGNIYYSGYYSNGSDFNVGPGTYTVASKGNSDPFIAKYDSSYNLLWVKTMAGSVNYDYGYDICVDDSGYVYGVGVTFGTSDLDPGSAVLTHSVGTSGIDMYIIKLDSAGTMKWVEAYPSADCYYSYFQWKIKLDNDGNLVTSTYFAPGTVDFSFGQGAPQPHTFSSAKYGMFKQTRYQQFIWLQDNIFALDFTFDEHNNIYAVSDKMRICRLNSAGTQVWSYTLGTNSLFPNYTYYAGADIASAINYDKRGNICITGSNRNDLIDYNPGSGVQTLSHNYSSKEIYVLKWDTAANFKWVKKFDAASGCGTQYYNFAEDIETDSRGNIYTCGGMGVCDLDPSSTGTQILGQACNGTELFISKLDSSGNYVWASSFGSVNGTDYLKTLAVTPAENVVFGGFFSYRIDIDPGPGITYIGTNTSLQNGLLGGVGCNKFSVIKDSTCVFPYTLNGYNYNQSGSYVQSIAASGAGCDSLIYLDLRSANPVISISSNTAICVGNAASLTVNSTPSNVTYEWSTGDNTPGITVSPSVNVVYTATLTNTSDSNCKSVGTVSVTVNNLPLVTVNSLTVCAGTSTFIVASGAVTYTWDNGATTGSLPVTPIADAEYTVTGTSLQGCVNTATAQITTLTTPTLNVSSANTTLCSGDSTVLSVSGADSYTWSTGAITSSVSVVPPATTQYSVTGTNANGCSKTGFATVTVNSLPNVTLSTLSSPVCDNAGLVTLNGLPGGGVYTGPGVSGNQFDPTSVGAGTYTITYSYTDANSCSASATRTVQVSVCTAISELTKNLVSISPNPVQSVVTISSTADLEKVEIINLTGQVLFTEQASSKTYQLNVETLANGIYFIKAYNSSKQVALKKLVVQK